MNSRASIALVGALSLGVLTLGACRKSESTETKTDTKTATATEETKATRPKPPPIDEGIDVPTEEDFEDSTTAEITDTSDLQKELDKLEKEIGK